MLDKKVIVTGGTYGIGASVVTAWSRRVRASRRWRILIGGKLGDPDRDLAPVIVFLCGDGARYITGQTLAIDGGALMVR